MTGMLRDVRLTMVCQVDANTHEAEHSTPSCDQSLEAATVSTIRTGWQCALTYPDRQADSISHHVAATVVDMHMANEDQGSEE